MLLYWNNPVLKGIPREHQGIPVPTGKARYTLSLLADVGPKPLLESPLVESVVETPHWCVSVGFTRLILEEVSST